MTELTVKIEDTIEPIQRHFEFDPYRYVDDETYRTAINAAITSWLDHASRGIEDTDIE